MKSKNLKFENLKLASLDFEFNGTDKEILNLVCCTVITEEGTREFWLHKREGEKTELGTYLLQLKNEGYVFLAFQAVAEGRSVYSLLIRPMELEWIDLFLEYRCITNHNDKMMYGKQLVNGKVKTTRRPPPKWERTDKDAAMGFSPTHSLAEATYKLTGIIRDTKHKEEMRDLIISAPVGFTLEQKNDIQDYCTEDTKFLPEMFKLIIEKYKDLLKGDFKEHLLIEEMLYRGSYQALTSIREAKGYPIDLQKTINFSRQVPLIISECQRDINSQFPEVMPFRYKVKEQKFSWNQIATKKWLTENVDVAKWKKTDKKALSLSKDAFEMNFHFRHSYPRGNFGAQMLRYLKLKQALNGFIPSKKKNFWDSVGEDGQVRPYMNPFGSMTSRSQPGSTGFIPLKPAWTRSLIAPPKGKAITAIDYGSEEFFISALVSEDPAMIKAYLSGDVYLYFAKVAKVVPWDGVRAVYESVRDAFKSTVLGLSYDMTKYGLAKKLTADTGRVWTEDEAQEQIDLFEESFPDFMDFKKDVQYTYEQDDRLQLADGWYLWGDNDNKRSVGNFPIQGMGAAIMRKADLLCHEYGLYVPYTLHDALYILHDSDDLGAVDKALRAMREAFEYFFEGKMREYASKIRMDVKTFGPDYFDGQKLVTPNGIEIKAEKIHVDGRAIDEYNKFSKYFETTDLDGVF